MQTTLTVEDVHEFLRERFGSEVSTPEPIGHGEWSRAFFYRHAQRDLVIRFSAYADDFLKDQRVMTSASAKLPVPKIVESGAAFGRTFAISERLFGVFFEERDADAMQRVLPSLWDTLDALREVEMADAEGFGLWRGSDAAAPYATWREALRAIATDPPSSRTHGWRSALDAAPAAARAYDAAFERMRTLLDACPNARHLVHSDLLNFNVLAEGDRISGVLDWGSSLYGDWLWDVAWITFWQPWYTAWSSVDIRGEATRHFGDIGLSVPHLAERLRCYELAIGLDGLAYQAFSGPGRTDDLTWTTRRVLGLLEQRL